MKANAQPLNEILFANVQFLVPFFQRSYSWDRDNWDRLGGDIQTLLSEDLKKKHFLGPLVCSLRSAVPGQASQYQLIDGQQRLTTLSLLLVAIRDEALRTGDEELGKEIEAQFLINQFRKGLERYKLVPRTGDRELFTSLIDSKPVDDGASRLVSGHEFFTKFIRTHAHQNDGYLRKLFDTVVSRLFLVTITLDEEDPYEIFESLNSTGLPLEESDLIRNFLFMQIPLEQQEDFQMEHWAPFEAEFDPVGDEVTIGPTKFYRDFLMRRGDYSKSKETFSDFKRYFEEKKVSPTETVKLLRRFVGHAKAIVNQSTTAPPKIAMVLRHFVWMESSTAFPVVLNLLEQRHQGTLSDDDFFACISDLNSFILRRSICGESTRAYGRWFCELAGQLDDDGKTKLRAYLLHRGWPDDETFQRSLAEFPIYRREFKKCRIILESLERDDGHKELVDLTKPQIQIEHVMPQTLPSGTAGKQWRDMLGDRPKKTHGRLLHTLGNLTLSGYNQPLGNKSFDEKRKVLAASKLSLNKIFNSESIVWNEAQIKSRAEKLCRQVCDIWTRPESPVVYVPPAKAGGGSNKTRERRVSYWAAFTDLLEASSVSLRPLRKCDGRILDFFLPLADVSLSARLVPQKKQITIQLQFSRARGKQMYSGLELNRDAINKSFTTPPSWDSGKKPTITFSKPDFSIRDRYDWLEHHKWLVRVLSEIETDLIGRVESLHKAVKEKSPTKQALLDFWIGFHTRMFERKCQLLATTALPQQWNDLAIGRSGIWTFAHVRPSESSISFALIMNTKYSPVFYPQLEQQKQNIESEFGDSLKWNNSDKLKQWRISISKNECHLSNVSSWSAHHDWLIDQAEKFDAVFRGRIQELNGPDSSQDGDE